MTSGFFLNRKVKTVERDNACVSTLRKDAFLDKFRKLIYRDMSRYETNPLQSTIFSELFGPANNLEIVENIILFLYMCYYGPKDRKIRLGVAAFAYIKNTCSGSGVAAVAKLCKEAQGYIDMIMKELTPQNSVENFFDKANKTVDAVDAFSSSPFSRGVHRLFVWVLSYSLLGEHGEFKKDQFSKIEIEALKIKSADPTFGVVIVKTLLLVAERGYQCIKTGSFDPIFHDGSHYDKWSVKALDLRTKYKCISNPEGHGFTKFEFIAELNEAIDKGDSIYRQASRMGDFERKMVLSFLSELKFIKDDLITKREAQKERKAPFSILLYGGTKVAKSTFAKLVITQYGKIFNLPLGSEYRYVRSCQDEYWSNFNSSQWALQLDDIGFMDPNYAKDGDPSVMEMLQVINNVPYVPPQAAIEDKGRTPVLSRFVVATTNTKTLNALHYFSHPIAALRRLPFVVTITPKDEFSKDGKTLDSELLPRKVVGYPNYWNILVQQVVMTESKFKNKNHAGYKDVLQTDDINIFTDWFTKASLDFEAWQSAAVNIDKSLETLQFCDICFRAKTACCCAHLCTICRLPSNNCMCCRCGGESCCTCTCRICKRLTSDCICQGLRFQAAVPVNVDENHLVCYKPPDDKKETSYSLYYRFWALMVAAYFYSIVFRLIIDFTVGPGFLWRRVRVIMIDPFFYREMFKKIGSRVRKKIGDHPKLAKYIAGGIAATLTIYILNKVYVEYIKSAEEKAPLQSDNVTDAKEETKVIGLDASEERQNFWVKNDYEVTTHDFRDKTRSYKALTPEQISESILRNCITMVVICPHTNQIMRVRAVCIIGHIYITNAHAVKWGDDQPRTIDFIVGKKQNVNGNVTGMMRLSQIRFYPGTDLASFEIRYLPPRKSIIDLFAYETFDGRFCGVYLGVNADGTNEKINLKKYQKRKAITHAQIDKPFDAWYAVSDRLTVVGDCGLVNVMFTNDGPVILGIHNFLGMSSEVVAISTPFHVIKMIEGYYTTQFEPSKLDLETDISHMQLQNYLHWKSPILKQYGCAEVYGSLSGFRGHPKTLVERTLISKAVRQLGYKTNQIAPDMKDPRPWNIAYEGFLACKNMFDTSLVDICYSEIYSHIIEMLPKSELDLIGEVPDRAVINGIEGVSFIDPINKRSSMGFPHFGPKVRYLEPDPIEGSEHHLKLNDKFMEDIVRMENTYRDGFLCHPIFCGNLKDEPISEKKYRMGKIRVFTSVPMKYSFLIRKHFLGFVRVMSRNPYVFCSAPGIIAQSLEWEMLLKYLHYPIGFGGDYKHFDKSQMAYMIWKVQMMIIDIQNLAGQGNVKVRQGLAEDNCYPFVILNGDLIRLLNGLVSGINMTTQVNCLINVGYLLYCWVVIMGVENIKQFWTSVKLMTYGDDNIVGISDNIKHKFNHSTVAEVLRKCGIEYTMPDKESASRPYWDIRDCSFLKRKWRFDNDVGAYVAPIEKETICKMLNITVRSRTIGPQEQALSIIASAVREVFFHGKESFEEFTTHMKIAVGMSDLNEYVKDSTFPTYDDLVLDFWRNSRHLMYDKWPVLLGQNKPKISLIDTDLQYLDDPEDEGLSVHIYELPHESVPQSPYLGKDTLGSKFLENHDYCLGGHYPGVNTSPAKTKSQVTESNPLQMDVAASTSLRGAAAPPAPSSNPATDSRVSAEGTEIKPGQGGPGYSGTKFSSLHQTTRFLDETLSNTIVMPSVTRDIDVQDRTAGMELKDFLSRPVKIGSIVWDSSAAVATQLDSFNPFFEYFTHPVIAKKMDNYAFVRCNLKVKFVLNASPFLYGAARIGYTPLATLKDANYNFTTTQSSLIPFSQVPGAWLYPQSNQGAELTLPFFSPNNFLDVRPLVQEPQITLNDFGTIDVRVFAPLLSANGVAAPAIPISIYVWAEDVVLSAPTISLTFQSDEYGDRVISKTATSVANAARLLRDVPIVGPYARATEMGARAVGAAAHALGYTNVPVIEPPCGSRLTPYPSISSSEIGYPIEKLSLDPKNELSIDPLICGLNNADELTLANIVRRESYLTYFLWEDTDPEETQKFLISVGPSSGLQISPNTPTGSTCLALTPMTWASNMFCNWRGDIIYKFVVVGTTFHKGRLRVSFDPAGTTVNNLVTSTGPIDEEVASTVIDIDKDMTAEFRVPYQQYCSWLSIRDLQTQISSPSNYWQTSGFNWAAIRDINLFNGMLQVRVLNSLTGPVSPSDVRVLVFVRAADNFELANPREFDKESNISYYPMQCDEWQPLQADVAMQMVENSAPGTDEIDNVIAGVSPEIPTDYRYLTNMGENIQSFRQLLRRASLVGSVTFGTYADNILLERGRSRYPMGFGAVAGESLARNLAGTANITFSWETMHPIAYIQQAFIATRGSVNWSFDMYNYAAKTNNFPSTVSRFPWTQNYVAASGIVATTGTTAVQRSLNNRFFKDNWYTNTAGGSITNSFHQPVINVVSPLYSRYKFLPIDGSHAARAQTKDFYTDNQGLLYQAIVANSTASSYLLEYAAIGVDYNLHFFLCAPLLFIYNVTPGVPV